MAGIVDYNEKMRDINGDYEYAEGAYNNIKEIIKKLESDNVTNTAGSKDQLLSQMGHIVEHSLKYFYKLVLLRDHPELTIDTFNKIMKLMKGALKNVYDNNIVEEITREHVPSSVDTGFNKVQGPLSHDLLQLLTILDNYHHDTKELINDLQFEETKSNLIEQMTTEDYISAFGMNIDEENLKLVLSPYYCFPSLLFESDLVLSRGLESNQLEKVRNQLHEKYITLEKARDAFVRFRYISSNPERIELDVEEVNHMTICFLDAAKMVHTSGNNLGVNPQVAFARYYLSEHPEFRKRLINYSDENINKIFEIDEIKDNVPFLAICLFSPNSYSSPEEIKKIVSSPEIDEDDYIDIVYYGLTLDTIKYFRENGIYRYETMQSELLEGKVGDDRLIAMIFNSYCSLEEYKKQREQLSLQNGELVHSIIDKSFDEDALIAIGSNPEICDYLAKKEYPAKREYFYSSGFVNELLKLDELRDNKDAWIGLDISQLLSFDLINCALNNSSRTETLMTKDNILSNIRTNIEQFKNNPRLLSYMPLMMDPNDISQIYRMLQSYNLTDEQIMEIDSSVFCMPVDFLLSFQLDETSGLIIDGELNPEVNSVFKNAYAQDIYNRYIIRDKVTPDPDYSLDEKLQKTIALSEERKGFIGVTKDKFNQVFGIEKTNIQKL